MKKLVSILLVMVLGIAPMWLLGGCFSRAETLKLYNWGDYMDEQLYKEFEVWYKEKTGTRVKVKPIEFETNEAMLTAIEKDKGDYDLVCPSDYMIERMISKNLLLPLNKEIIDVELDGLFMDYYLDVTRNYDPELTYSFPYMYGTLGVMYNYEKTKKHITSWSSVFTDELSSSNNRKIFMKDSSRDAFASAGIYSMRNKLSELSNGFTDYGDAYQLELQRIFEDTSGDALDAIELILKAQKPFVLDYEVDDGKFFMAGGTTEAIMDVVWSCDSGYVMGDYEDAGGLTMKGNKGLWYSIPNEGGNVYTDSFVIPKYAKNIDAANWFLKFLAETEVAVKNSYYVGAIPPLTAARDQLFEEMSGDDEFFAEAANGWKEMYLDMMFPSDRTLARCAVMKDFGEKESEITSMIADIFKS